MTDYEFTWDPTEQCWRMSVQRDEDILRAAQFWQPSRHGQSPAKLAPIARLCDLCGLPCTGGGSLPAEGVMFCLGCATAGHDRGPAVTWPLWLRVLRWMAAL